jgi:transposase
MPETAAGFTVTDLARRYRVSEDKIRGWIRRGELAAVNRRDVRSGRPSWVVTWEALVNFERGRAATPPPKPTRRKARAKGIDYFVD